MKLLNIIRSKGQGGLSGGMIGILIAIIIGVAVAIPVINDVISDANLSGTTKIIIDLLPVMVGLLLFVGIAGLMGIGRK
jgi:hypothetical protein